MPFDIAEFQPRVWAVLARSFETGRLGGTYLVHGREGTGRWALSLSLAALVNCEQPSRSLRHETLIPCGSCSQCRRIFALNSEVLFFALPIPPHRSFDEAIDLTSEALELKRQEPFLILTSSSATNIPIAMARDINRKLSRRAAEGQTRVVVFYRMESMKVASADALLKLIEEPPRDTIIVLVARRPEILLPTIQSRTRKFKLNRIADEVVTRYLSERYRLSGGRASLLAKLADGSLGKAISLIETDEDTDLSERSVGFMLFKSLLTEPSLHTISQLTDLVGGRDRGQSENLLGLWQSLTRDCAHYAICGAEADIVNVDFASEIKRLAGLFTDRHLACVIADNIKNALADLRRNVHIHGALAALVLKTRHRSPGYGEVAAEI